MTAEDSAPVTVLSPHLDDAVFSSWHALEGDHRSVVVTFFSGVPPPGPPTLADRLAGVPDSAGLVRLRREEDRAALAKVGCEVVYLDLLDVQYRESGPDGDQLFGSALEVIPSGSAIAGPAALGGHRDHKAIRDVALRLAQEGWKVELYADIPYAIEYGWPEWVTGIDPGPHLVVEAYWDDFLDEVRTRGHRLEIQKHDLTEEGSDRKLEVMRMYRTQFQQLNAGIVDRLVNPAIRRYEVSWKVS